MDNNIANMTQRLTVVENDLKRLDHIINGNGQPGLASRLEKLITELYRLKDSLERIEKKSQEKKLDWQWLATALIAAAAVITSLLK